MTNHTNLHTSGPTSHGSPEAVPRDPTAVPNTLVHRTMKPKPLTSIEICAGAGGQAIGLEKAGFRHTLLLEVDDQACRTLRRNRDDWNTVKADITKESTQLLVEEHGPVSLLAGGVPCPPFSKAGKQLGADDDRDLFPAALELLARCDADALMLENVRGLFDERFRPYREQIKERLAAMGYWSDWQLLNASDFGVPQLRPRTILVAFKQKLNVEFAWPKPRKGRPETVASALRAHLETRGWDASRWAEEANGIAPTLVGGSKKHGGPDLGPTRAKKQWEKLGVNAHVLADEPPSADFEGMPKLTVQMAAAIQGFDSDWVFVGGKTHAYRQVGNAFPPPVAKAVGQEIAKALRAAQRRPHLIYDATGRPETESASEATSDAVESAA